MLSNSPSALIVPFVIDGNYKLQINGKFPLKIGLKLKYVVLEPVERNTYSDEELLKTIENRIKKELGQV